MLSFYEKGVTLADSIPCMPVEMGVQRLGHPWSAASSRVLGNCVRPEPELLITLLANLGGTKKPTLALPPN